MPLQTLENPSVGYAVQLHWENPTVMLLKYTVNIMAVWETSFRNDE